MLSLITDDPEAGVLEFSAPARPGERVRRTVLTVLLVSAASAPAIGIWLTPRAAPIYLLLVGVALIGAFIVALIQPEHVRSLRIDPSGIRFQLQGRLLWGRRSVSLRPRQHFTVSGFGASPHQLDAAELGIQITPFFGPPVFSIRGLDRIGELDTLVQRIAHALGVGVAPGLSGREGIFERRLAPDAPPPAAPVALSVGYREHAARVAELRLERTASYEAPDAAVPALADIPLLPLAMRAEVQDGLLRLRPPLPWLSLVVFCALAVGGGLVGNALGPSSLPPWWPSWVAATVGAASGGMLWPLGLLLLSGGRWLLRPLGWLMRGRRMGSMPSRLWGSRFGGTVTRDRAEVRTGSGSRLCTRGDAVFLVVRKRNDILRSKKTSPSYRSRAEVWVQAGDDWALLARTRWTLKSWPEARAMRTAEAIAHHVARPLDTPVRSVLLT